MTTWGQLEDVQSVDIASLNSWQVSGSLFDSLGSIGVDDEWTLSHHVSGVSVFTNTGSDFLRFFDFQEIICDTKFVQSSKELAGGILLGNTGVNNKWELWDSVDVVSSGHHKGSACSGSEG